LLPVRPQVLSNGGLVDGDVLNHEPAAAAPLHPDRPLTGQHCDGLAHRGARHVKHLGEVAFTWQRIARSIAPERDRCSDLFENELMGGRGFDRPDRTWDDAVVTQ